MQFKIGDLVSIAGRYRDPKKRSDICLASDASELTHHPLKVPCKIFAQEGSDFIIEVDFAQETNAYPPPKRWISNLNADPNKKYWIAEPEILFPRSIEEINRIDLAIKQEAILSCRGCSEFYPYAVANCKDGTLVCWSCRSTNGWKFANVLI